MRCLKVGYVFNLKMKMERPSMKNTQHVGLVISVCICDHSCYASMSHTIFSNQNGLRVTTNKHLQSMNLNKKKYT